jgi:hypothetical protein
VEKYYGGEESCYYSCETFNWNDGTFTIEKEMDWMGSSKERPKTSEPVLIEL